VTLQGSEMMTDDVRTAARLLAQILSQDIEDDEGPDDSGDGGPRLRQGVAPDPIISTVDPEMRRGRKSEVERFDGFKVHVTDVHRSRSDRGGLRSQESVNSPSKSRV